MRCGLLLCGIRLLRRGPAGSSEASGSAAGMLSGSAASSVPAASVFGSAWGAVSSVSLCGSAAGELAASFGAPLPQAARPRSRVRTVRRMKNVLRNFIAIASLFSFFVFSDA